MLLDAMQLDATQQEGRWPRKSKIDLEDRGIGQDVSIPTITPSELVIFRPER